MFDFFKKKFKKDDDKALSPGFDKKAEELFKQAIDDRNRGDLDSALKNLSMSLSYGGSAAAYLERAKTFLLKWQANRKDENLHANALRDVENAKKLDVDNALQQEMDDFHAKLKELEEAGKKQEPARVSLTREMSAASRTVDINVSIGNLEKTIANMGGQLHEVFGPPETVETFAAAEQLLGQALPADYKVFLEKVGGQRFIRYPEGEDTGSLMQFISNFDILGLRNSHAEYIRMVDEWDGGEEYTIETKGPVKPLFKSTAWWPIIDMGHEWLMIDLDPASGGSPGQIIFVCDNDFNRRVVAQSFNIFTNQLVRLLNYALANPQDSYRIDGWKEQGLDISNLLARYILKS